MLPLKFRVAAFAVTFMLTLFIQVFAESCPTAAKTVMTQEESLSDELSVTSEEKNDEPMSEDEITSRVIGVVIAAVVISGTVMLLLAIAPERHD